MKELWIHVLDGVEKTEMPIHFVLHVSENLQKPEV